jgi:hypothetical protein
MIYQTYDGVFNVDGFVNGANMSVAGSMSSFVFVRAAAGLYNIINSENTGDIVQRINPTEITADSSFYAGAFVAYSYAGAATFLINDSNNTGDIVGKTDIDNYHFVGYTYDENDNSTTEVDKHTNGVASTGAATSDPRQGYIHEFIGIYSNRGATIILKNSESKDDGEISHTKLATGVEEGRDFDLDYTEQQSGQDFSFELIEDNTKVRITGQTTQSVVSELTIPSEIDGKPVTEIAANAFKDNLKLKSVTIRNNVLTMGENAFQGTLYLRSVTFDTGSPLTVIPSRAFNGASSLVEINLPTGLLKIDDYAFQDAKALPSISIPNSVTYIGIDAFKATWLLTNVELPDSELTIRGGAFTDTKSLEYIVIPGTVKTIWDNAFPNNAGAPNFAIFVDLLEEDVIAWVPQTGWHTGWKKDNLVYYQDEWSYDVSGIPTPN